MSVGAVGKCLEDNGMSAFNPLEQQEQAEEDWVLIEDLEDTGSMSPFVSIGGIENLFEEPLSEALLEDGDSPCASRVNKEEVASQAVGDTSSALREDPLEQIKKAFQNAIRATPLAKTWTVAYQSDLQPMDQIFEELKKADLSPTLESKESNSEITITAPEKLVDRHLTLIGQVKSIGTSVLCEIQIARWEDKVTQKMKELDCLTKWQFKCLTSPQPIYARVLNAFATHMEKKHGLKVAYYSKDRTAANPIFYKPSTLQHLDSKKKLYFQITKI